MYWRIIFSSYNMNRIHALLVFCIGQTKAILLLHSSTQPPSLNLGASALFHLTLSQNYNVCVRGIQFSVEAEVNTCTQMAQGIKIVNKRFV